MDRGLQFRRLGTQRPGLGILELGLDGRVGVQSLGFRV